MDGAEDGTDGGRSPGGSVWSPAEVALDQAFGVDGLHVLRAAVAAHAGALGLPEDRIGGLVVLASELATNAVRHGGGSGRLRLWRTGSALFCQVADPGRGIADPAGAGTRLVSRHAEGGRGLWIIRQLSDHLRIEGSTVTAVLLLADSPAG
ncbi:ATP-binding protein [Longispora urticae]